MLYVPSVLLGGTYMTTFLAYVPS